MNVLQLSSDIEVAHIGPSLEKGRLPSVFYFALSAQESLELEPFNQPAKYLAKQGIRVFSLDLPAHGPDLQAIDAVGIWAEEFQEGRDPLAPFLKKVHFAFDALMEKGLIVREKIGLMGLSRGGLIAALLSAQYEVRSCLCFAPLTELTFARAFKKSKEIPQAEIYNLTNHLDALCEKKIRIYIGNRDICIGTDKCYSLAWELANAAFEKGLRSPPIELIISPSIGHLGHGTPKEIFESGADWLGKTLGAIR
ncbi:MAG: hypothetical protein KR126chlam3_00154 [Chlamydiae bacterium]|nr:hypothetical protein [Chlamydiota bacterium]